MQMRAARLPRLVSAVGVLLPLVGVATPVLAYPGDWGGHSGVFREDMMRTVGPAVAAAFLLTVLRSRTSCAALSLGLWLAWSAHGVELLDAGPIMWDGRDAEGNPTFDWIVPRPTWAMGALALGALACLVGAVLALVLRPVEVAHRAPPARATTGQRVLVTLGAAMAGVSFVLPLTGSSRDRDPMSVWGEWGLGSVLAALALGVLAAVAWRVASRVPMVVLALLLAGPWAMLARDAVGWSESPIPYGRPDIGAATAAAAALLLVVGALWAAVGPSRRQPRVASPPRTPEPADA